MVAATYRIFDPLLPRAQAERMLGLCERFGAYGMYSQEASEAEIGQGLFQRHDAVMNFLKTGGRFGRHDSIEALGARTNYFRETYAYGDEVRIDGIEPFLRYEGFVEAARAIHGRPVVEPAIVYANLLVPGQELAVHTDVPEFRGANRKLYPQWLMVVMHHSGLFDEYRMPIATAVGWFNDRHGGEFAFYPQGGGRPGRDDRGARQHGHHPRHGLGVPWRRPGRLGLALARAAAGHAATVGRRPLARARPRGGRRALPLG